MKCWISRTSIWKWSEYDGIEQVTERLALPEKYEVKFGVQETVIHKESFNLDLDEVKE